MAETLVLIELDRQRVKRPSLHAITLAQQLGGDYALLILGSGVAEAANSIISYGAAAVLVADDPALAEPLADRYASVVAQATRQQGAKRLVASSSTFSKDVLPRAAALLDAPMGTDLLAIAKVDGTPAYQRPMNAGSKLATVKVDGEVCVLTARATAFAMPSAKGAPCPIETFAFDAASLPNEMQFVSRELRASDRPDLGEARVVVSGGRPLKDSETSSVSSADWLMRSVAPSVRLARPLTPAWRLTITRSARPAKSSRPSSTSRSAFPARSSTWPASKIRAS